MTDEITIVDFDAKYQPGVDRLLESIQNEYPENIYGPGVLKMRDAALIAGRRYWVALYDDEVIGTVGLIRLSNNNAVLKSMMLHKDHRGRKRQIAYQLMSVAIRAARAQTLYLGTMAQFKAACTFYTRHGFTEITEKELPPDFIGNPVDVVFFKLAL